MSYAQDGISMGLSRVMELVSQAEKEGVSLGVMISRELSAEEIDAAQLDIAEAMRHNYAKIGHFMAGIEIPSLEDIMAQEPPLSELQAAESSDELSS